VSNCLREGGEGVAVVAGVAGEALAQAAAVVALASAAALVRVGISRLVLGDIGGSLVDSGLQTEAVDLGRASGAALIVLDGDQVLLALHGIAGEGDAHGHTLLVILVAL